MINAQFGRNATIDEEATVFMMPGEYPGSVAMTGFLSHDHGAKLLMGARFDELPEDVRVCAEALPELLARSEDPALPIGTFRLRGIARLIDSWREDGCDKRVFRFVGMPAMQVPERYRG